MSNRDQLMTEHIGLVYSVVRKLRIPVLNETDEHDLVSVGMEGLLEAADRFDPELGLKFSTFAVPRIQGAIKDDLRRRSLLSRQYRRHSDSIVRARRELEARLFRPSTSREIAELLGISVETFWSHELAIVHQREESVDAPDPEMAHLSDKTPDILEVLVRKDLSEYLGQLVSLLSSQQEVVVRLFYWEQLNQKEVAECLGVSESRVSQIRIKALTHLRSLVGDAFR